MSSKSNKHTALKDHFVSLTEAFKIQEEQMAALKVGHEAPRSVRLMATMAQEIIEAVYTNYQNYVTVLPFQFPSQAVGLSLVPSHNALDAEERPTTQYHTAVKNFIDDLSLYDDGGTFASKEEVTMICADNKMGLYKLLSTYVYCKEGVFSPDTVTANPESAAFQNGMKVMREKMSDPVEWEGYVFRVNASPYGSVEEFERACYACSFSTVSVPLDHLFQTICQEEKHDPHQIDRDLFSGKLTFGGYH